jgi:PAS domain S-box-containing protein
LLPSFAGRESLPVNLIANALSNQNGRVMTTQKQTDENTERLKMAQAAAQLGTWEWDPVESTQSLSEELHRIFGTEPSDPDRVAKWAARVHPADWAKVQQLMEEGHRSGEMEFDYRYHHPELGLRWLHCKGRRFRNQTRMLGIVQDITERKIAEEGAQRLAAIVASSDDAIVSKDLHGIVTSWNPGAERTFGYTAEEMIGQPITKIIPLNLHDEETRILATIARGERIQHYETLRLAKSGSLIEVSLTVSPVRDEDGNIVGAAKIARDITQRKKTERALQMTERLASVGRLAATVAHEINNPLEAVINLIYLARRASSQIDARRFLGLAEEELERVSHLTKQTLGFYRETKGATRFRLGEIVTSLLSVFASRTRNRGIAVLPEIEGDIELYAVPGEIRQVVANLVSNSIDALDGGGQGGKVRIRVAPATQWSGDETHGVRLTVADTGSGIPASVRAQLFEPFFTTKKDVGTGLGLWVCKSIVENHRGSIRMRSATTPGKSWTVFSVFLPLNAQKPAAEEPIPQAV